MKRLGVAARAFGLGTVLLAGWLAPCAMAAKLENTFYAASTVLFLKVPDAALRKLLPAGWEPAAVPAMGDGNLTATFTDIVASEGPDGRAGATARAVWLSAPVQRSAGGERAGAVLTGLASDPAFAPGPYGNYVLAEASLDRRRQVEPGNVLISERWEFAAGNGAKVELRLAFAGGQAQHLKPPPSKVLSATDPSPRRLNRTEVVAQQLQRNDAALKEIAFAASGPLLSSLFDGSEQIIAVVSAPWLVTQVFVP